MPDSFSCYFKSHLRIAQNFLRLQKTEICWNSICWDHDLVHITHCFVQAGTYRCSCRAGWSGQNCDIDEDECLSEPCQNGATCIDKVSVPSACMSHQGDFFTQVKSAHFVFCIMSNISSETPSNNWCWQNNICRPGKNGKITGPKHRQYIQSV